jgi:hypothetical protein
LEAAIDRDEVIDRVYQIEQGPERGLWSWTKTVSRHDGTIRTARVAIERITAVARAAHHISEYRRGATRGRPRSQIGSAGDAESAWMLRTNSL